MKYLKIGLIALALIGLEYIDASAAIMPSPNAPVQHRRHLLHHYRHHYVHHHRIAGHLPPPPPPPPAPPHP